MADLSSLSFAVGPILAQSPPDYDRLLGAVRRFGIGGLALALALAVRQRRYDWAEAILARAPVAVDAVYQLDGDRRTPLESLMHLDEARTWLLDHGADPNAAGGLALDWAARTEQWPLVASLLQRGGDPALLPLADRAELARVDWWAVARLPATKQVAFTGVLAAAELPVPSSLGVALGVVLPADLRRYVLRGI